ncbi:gasdermin-B [Rhynchocyon petersi]
MLSIFEKITKTVVQELDSRGDMIAVRSAIDADRLNCSYLVREKKTFFGSQYKITGLTLADILEEEGSGSAAQNSEFRISDHVDSNGEFAVALPKGIEIKMKTGMNQGTSGQEIKILGKRISQKHLDSLVDRKLKKKLPPSFESIRKKRENLYLVTETLALGNEEHLRWEEQRKSLLLEESRNMKEKVEDLRSHFRNLTDKEQEDMLSCLTYSLSNDGHLQDLEDRVSDAQMSELSEDNRLLVVKAMEEGKLFMLVEQVESTLKGNYGPQYDDPRDIDCGSEARFLYALYVAFSVLLQLKEKPTADSA